VGLLTLLCALVTAAEPNLPVPLERAHSHNDYEHGRPLLDALDRGFCSVEADVWLVDGKLLVAHDRKNAKAERTLQALYLEPLKARVEKNRGRVHSNGPTFTLLVDVKSDATNTYTVLREVLKSYETMLTRFQANRTETNAVTVIISGSRARDLMAAEAVRLAAYDGRLEDLDGAASTHFIPLISDNWSRLSQWKGTAAQGPLPAADRQKLKAMIERAHQQGRRVRLWSAPDRANAWQELLHARVDLINTDDLDGLKAFLLERQQD
jgi:glycerophosphoryl diester phosphodiesterase